MKEKLIKLTAYYVFLRVFLCFFKLNEFFNLLTLALMKNWRISQIFFQNAGFINIFFFWNLAFKKYTSNFQISEISILITDTRRFLGFSLLTKPHQQLFLDCLCYQCPDFLLSIAKDKQFSKFLFFSHFQIKQKIFIFMSWSRTWFRFI